MNPRLEQAMACRDAGLSLIPIGAHSKTPRIKEWKPFQERLPTDSELAQWVDQCPGLAIVCGEVSGNLEVLDIEAKAPIKEFIAAVNLRAPGLLDKLVTIRSAGGGVHYYFRNETAIDSNKKLAANANGETLIETRGRGG